MDCSSVLESIKKELDDPFQDQLQVPDLIIFNNIKQEDDISKVTSPTNIIEEVSSVYNESFSTKTEALIKLEPDPTTNYYEETLDSNIKSEELDIKEVLEESEAGISSDCIGQGKINQFGDETSLKTISRRKRSKPDRSNDNKSSQNNPEEVDADVFICNKSNFQTTSKQSFKLHERRYKHSKDDVFKCNKCAFQTVHKQSFKRHKLRHSKPNDEVLKTFQCVKCSFKTVNKLQLNHHVLGHSNPAAGNKQPNCVCAVCNILEKGFANCNLAKQNEIISSGRHMPYLDLECKVEKSAKKFTRHFNKDFYDKYEWLTGCDTLLKLFCWPCLLFNASEKNPWISSGFSDLNNFHKNVKIHANSRGHLIAILKEKSFSKKRVEHNLDNQLEMNLKLHNEIVGKNRDIFKRLIDITCFLGEHELSFRGPQEDMESVNRGNYMNLLEFLSNYDETLKIHLENATVFRGTSNRIQNDLIKCVADVVFDNIKHEVKLTPFVSIALDETTDISNISRLAVVVRYVKSDGTIQERFLGFLDNTTERTATTIHTIVCGIIKELDCGSKLVAQSYDGAVVTADHLDDLQAKVKKTFKNAIFVHWFAHRLNSVLSQSLGLIKDCKIFFSTLSGIAVFFSTSSKRSRALDVQVQKRFPNVEATQWNDSGQLVQTVSKYREELIELYKNTLDGQEEWDPETVNFSRGYLQLLENDFDFNFLLKVFSYIFPHTDLLFDILQTKSNDIGSCVQHIKELKNLISQKRDQFYYFWKETINLNLVQRGRRLTEENMRDMEPSYRQLFLEIVDNITQQLRSRFQNFNELKFLELCNFSNYIKKRFPDEALTSLKEYYGNFFDVPALRSQLGVTYDTEVFNGQKSALNMLLFIKKTGLEKAYNEVFKLCELVLTVPATSTSAEHSFSILKLIKNFNRNSTREEGLSNLAVLSIEREFIRDLSRNPKFYDDVINKFSKVDRQIELQYK